MSSSSDAGFPRAVGRPRRAASPAICFPSVPQGATAMNGEMLRRVIRITKPQGFHLRVKTAFAQLARKYQSTVILSWNTVRADGKSPLDLMLLAAGQGEELLLEVSGEDAAHALEALAELLATLPDDEDGETPGPAKG